jgi:hypothetical protein
MPVVLVILAVVVVLYLVGRSAKKRAQESLDLRFFEWDDSVADLRSSWRFDLVQMTATQSASSPDLPRRVSNFQVRRDGSAAWSIKFTLDSWNAEIAHARESMTNPYASKATWEEILQRLGDEPSWQPVRDDIVGPLESQFQRFVVHYQS